MTTSRPLKPGTLSPKRPPVETAGLADLFPYYAGFSFDWACSQIIEGVSDPSATIFDPWNGSGTTTNAARHMGFQAIGVDLNPVANVIAKLRVMSHEVLREVEPPTVFDMEPRTIEDPLNAWFSKATSNRLRQWATCRRAVTPGQAQLMLAAVFRVARTLTKQFEGSNPTWVRHAKSTESLVDVPDRELDEYILTEQKVLLEKIRSFNSRSDAPVSILRASADQLPLRSQSVDFILTSPPYLTRIDYAVAYARELALLGYNIRGSERQLRSQLMGTTLIRKTHVEAPATLGSKAQQLISDISAHKSKDSAGYYRKQVIQYFLDLVATLDEIGRVANDRATMQLVVQDSYYKDIPVPLADIYSEEAYYRGWTLDAAVKFDVIRSLTTLNTSARAYRKEKVHETMLVLRRSR